MISGPSLPVGATEAPGRAEDIVAGSGSRAVLFPEAAILADRHNRNRASFENGRVATAGVEAPISGYSIDLFILDLHRFCSCQVLILSGPLFEDHG